MVYKRNYQLRYDERCDWGEILYYETYRFFLRGCDHYKLFRNTLPIQTDYLHLCVCWAIIEVVVVAISLVAVVEGGIHLVVVILGGV